MTSFLDPYATFAGYIPFKVTQLPGQYVIEALEPPTNFLAISNCTLPTRYYGDSKSIWDGHYIDWSKCDYTLSFGIPNYPTPDYPTLCNLLLSNRIPGPCQPAPLPPVVIDPMEPTTLGTAYGKQDLSSHTNTLGYENHTSIVSGNCIGQSINDIVTGSETNLITSENNLTSNCDFQQSNILISGNTNILNTNTQQCNMLVSGTTNMTNNATHRQSNILITGDGSNFGDCVDSTLIGQGFVNSTNNMDKCIYIGDMANVIPSLMSMCVNNNLYGGSISMAKESVYIGSGANNISLNNNDFHIDARCPRLFYHDLQQGTTPYTLFFDNSTGQITWDTASTPSPSPDILSNIAAGGIVPFWQDAASSQALRRNTFNPFSDLFPVQTNPSFGIVNTPPGLNIPTPGIYDFSLVLKPSGTTIATDFTLSVILADPLGATIAEDAVVMKAGTTISNYQLNINKSFPCPSPGVYSITLAKTAGGGPALNLSIYGIGSYINVRGPY